MCASRPAESVDQHNAWRWRPASLLAAVRGRVRAALPPHWVVRWRRRGRPPLYSGAYASWADARRASSGYDSEVILQRAILAARAVREGRAAWERDTVLFHAPSPADPLRVALQQAIRGGVLEIVDFGGALGSTYHQHRPWLQQVSRVCWTVVEQPGFVMAGQREFTTDELRFRATVEEAAGEMRSPTLLLSGVLAYLEDPDAWIGRFRQLPFRRVIVDRTGFVRRGDDRLTVQQVPPEIYPASYPCRFFSRARLLATFGREWAVTAEWRGVADVDIPAEFRGFVLTRTEPHPASGPSNPPPPWLV